jgi:TrmH family RNA methyltransferase
VALRLANDDVLAAMADTVTPQGIVAVCSFVDVSLESVLDAGPRLIAVMCQVRDPGNAGTVLRAADAAGADAVVLTASSVDIYNPKAVRSTAGSLFHLPVVLGAEVEDLVALCKERGIGILAADGYGTRRPGCSAMRRKDFQIPSLPLPTIGSQCLSTVRRKA